MGDCFPITFIVGCFLAGFGLLFFLSGLWIPGFVLSVVGGLSILSSPFVD
jgi:hypothetical protein